MSTKKKRMITLGVLVGVLILIGLAYVVVPKSEKSTESDNKATATEEPANTIESIAADDVTTISVNAGDTSYTLRKGNSKWNFTDDKISPVNSEKVDSMLSSVQAIKSTKELAYEADKLDDYGLKKPVAKITIEDKDGKKHMYSIGSQTPVVGGYYAMNATKDKIYVLEEAFCSAFLVKRSDLMELVQAPSIKSNYITTLDIKKNGTHTFVTKYVGNVQRKDDYSNWNIYKPYKEVLPGNATEYKSSLLDKYTSYEVTKAVKYGEKYFKQYGVGDACKDTVFVRYFTLKSGASATKTQDANGNEVETVAEKDRDYHEFTLYIGKKAAKGEYYVRFSTSDGVFTMKSDSVSAYRDINVFTYVDHCVYATLATKLDSYEVITGKDVIKVRRKELKEKSKTTGSNINRWYYNGKEVAEKDEEVILSPYSSLYLLEYSGVAKASVKPKSKKPVVTVKYHNDKKTDVVKYMPYDGMNFYRVEKNGTSLFLVDKRAVDDVITKFKALKTML